MIFIYVNKTFEPCSIFLDIIFIHKRSEARNKNALAIYTLYNVVLKQVFLLNTREDTLKNVWNSVARSLE